jgi:hypothetical protein
MRLRACRDYTNWSSHQPWDIFFEYISADDLGSVCGLIDSKNSKLRRPLNNREYEIIPNPTSRHELMRYSVDRFLYLES